MKKAPRQGARQGVRENVELDVVPYNRACRASRTPAGVPFFALRNRWKRLRRGHRLSSRTPSGCRETSNLQKPASAGDRGGEWRFVIPRARLVVCTPEAFVKVAGGHAGGVATASQSPLDRWRLTDFPHPAGVPVTARANRWQRFRPVHRLPSRTPPQCAAEPRGQPTTREGQKTYSASIHASAAIAAVSWASSFGSTLSSVSALVWW